MSSTDVKIFEKEEFGSVRVVMQGDDPWFVAKDVCDLSGPQQQPWRYRFA